MDKLGRLQKVELREVWRHEERDFSTWLAEEENIELLADELGVELDNIRQEAEVGSFRVDLLAEEANTGRKVIIENQLESTNHDHLGKIITYAAGYDAEIIVWIVREARDEHRRAIEWLNEHTDESIGFFLIRMEVWRIGNSPPAPKFHVVLQPNDWAKAVKKTVNSGQLSRTKLLQLEYWEQLREMAMGISKSLRLKQPKADHWYPIRIGTSQAHISLMINKDIIGVDLYIRNNQALFNCLYKQKHAIEEAIGLSLDWQPLPMNKASYIRASKPDDYTRHDQWPEQHRWLLKTAEAFKEVFSLYVKNCLEVLANDNSAN